MVNRIIMDKDVLTFKKTYVKGQVYDSRFPLDMPTAADGVQHSIPQYFVDCFVAQGWAHEQTWDEWLNGKPLFTGEAA